MVADQFAAYFGALAALAGLISDGEAVIVGAIAEVGDGAVAATLPPSDVVVVEGEPAVAAGRLSRRLQWPSRNAPGSIARLWCRMSPVTFADLSSVTVLPL